MLVFNFMLTTGMHVAINSTNTNKINPFDFGFLFITC